jgi:hypothetical protein
MISFRFHIVSIAAVFLAIAIGVVVGSTYVDRAIVDNLEDRIESVSGNLDERREEIAALEQELGRARDEIDAGLSFAVTGRLPDVPVLVVATRGVDPEPIRRLVLLARQAGAVAPGVLWVEQPWALEEDGAVAALADVAGVRSSSADTVRAAAWEAALADLQAPPGDVETPTGEPVEPVDPAVPGSTPETTETTVDPAVSTTEPPATTTTLAERIPDTLSALLEGGYLTFEPVGDNFELRSLVARSPSVVLISGTEAEEAVAPFVAPLAEGAVDAGAATVVGEVFVEPAEDATDPPRRGDVAIEATSGLATDEVAVVDHLDEPIGTVAAVLALSDLLQGIAGHYGFGDGAAGILPAWTAL